MSWLVQAIKPEWQDAECNNEELITKCYFDLQLQLQPTLQIHPHLGCQITSSLAIVNVSKTVLVSKCHEINAIFDWVCVNFGKVQIHCAHLAYMYF